MVCTIYNNKMHAVQATGHAAINQKEQKRIQNLK
jgi:hypothetical protein